MVVPSILDNHIPRYILSFLPRDTAILKVVPMSAAHSTHPVKQYNAYVFDLDGTVYLGDELIPQAKETIDSLKDNGAAIRYITNNPTRTTQQYADKLSNLGIQTDESEVFNTVRSSVSWLHRYSPDATVYPIGEAPLIDALTEYGIAISDDPEEIDIVLVSYDRQLTYAKLKVAFDALWRSNPARLMATNPDKYCPLPGGKGEPDSGAILAALETATNIRAERHFGKPNRELIEEVLQEVSLGVEDAIIIGDRLETDIEMAHRLMMDSALVLTGDAQLKDLHGQVPSALPTYVLDSIAQLV